MTWMTVALRSKTLVAAVLIMALTLCSGPAGAGGLHMEPGKWQITTTMKMPMATQEKVTTTTECVTDNEITPEKLVADSQVCTFKDAAVIGNTMKWKVECPNPMGKAAGDGRFTSAGSTANGRMRMTMSLNGQPVLFETRWNGKRIGDCD